MTTENGGAARRFRYAWLVAAQATLMILLGFFVTRVADGHWPLTLEDRLPRAFAEHRSPLGNGLSAGLSLMASTEGIVGVTLVCVAALLVLPRAPRWTEAGFLGASVAVQSAVFLLVTIFVERPRPDVPQLDGAPPTSSFPSGHVGASVALYGGLATLVLSRTRGPWRYLTAGVLLLVPPAVGLSRVYRECTTPPMWRAACSTGARRCSSWASCSCTAATATPRASGHRTEFRAAGPKRYPLSPAGSPARTAGRPAAGSSSYATRTTARTSWRPRCAPGWDGTDSPTSGGPRPRWNGPAGASPKSAPRATWISSWPAAATAPCAPAPTWWPAPASRWRSYPAAPATSWPATWTFRPTRRRRSKRPWTAGTSESTSAGSRATASRRPGSPS